MDWLRWHLEQHKAVIITAAIVAAFMAVLSLLPPSYDGLRGANNGFGPDWECTSNPQSEPTCIKKLQH
jgi:hypothetical protein